MNSRLALSSLFSCLNLQSVRITRWHCHTQLCGARNGTQSFLHARQALYQLSYISIPCLLPKQLCFVPGDIASLQRCLSKYVLGTGRRHKDISDKKDVWSEEPRGDLRSGKFIRKSHDSPLHIWSYTEDTVFLLRVLFCGCFYFLLG